MEDVQDPGIAPRRRHSRPERAEAVYRATLAIATELSVGAVLQKIVDSSRDLVQARFGALGVIAEDGRRLARFIVSGVEPEQIRRMGHWPRGLGLLGELIQVHRPLRVKNIGSDPRSVGFPPHHPPMTSFLGVPILRGDRVLGNLYMTDKLDAEEFSEDDEEILSLFAAHAAIALDNARLYTETDLRLKEKVIEVERAERRARFMAELGELLLKGAPGEDPPFELVAERATEALGDAAALYLIDQQHPESVAKTAVFHTVQARSDAARAVVEGSWVAIEEQVIRPGAIALGNRKRRARWAPRIRSASPGGRSLFRSPRRAYSHSTGQLRRIRVPCQPATDSDRRRSPLCPLDRRPAGQRPRQRQAFSGRAAGKAEGWRIGQSGRASSLGVGNHPGHHVRSGLCPGPATEYRPGKSRLRRPGRPARQQRPFVDSSTAHGVAQSKGRERGAPFGQ